ncbi:MAG: hypothetical protein CSA94_00120 [Bacteroidetes bacterium]|nr:MAG: hypothetical protein CSA94_00120 [Bacteroidota bacterium]
MKFGRYYVYLHIGKVYNIMLKIRKNITFKITLIKVIALPIAIILVISGLFIEGKAQSKEDSLINILAQVSNNAQKINILYDLCKILRKESLEEAVIYFQDLVEVSKEIEDIDKKAEIYLLGEEIYRLKGDYEKAYYYDLEALKLKDEIKDVKLKATIYNTTGIDLYRLKKLELALTYFNKAKDIYIKTKDTKKLGDIYNNIALIYDSQNDHKKAKKYYLRSVGIFKEINNKDGEAEVLNNIAGIYYKEKNFDKTLEIVNKSLKIRREIGEQRPLAYTLLNIGALYFALQKYDKAIQYGQESIEIAEQIGILPMVKYASKNISEAYAKINDFENAYKYHIKYSTANDSIFNKEMAESINKLQTQYETKEKEQQIEMQKLEIQRITIFWIASLAIIVLILVLIIILVRQNKQKTAINQLLEQKNNELNTLVATKDKFFALISHDLKNPLLAFGNIIEQLDIHFEYINHDEIHSYIKDLSISSKQINNLLANLLQWAAVQNNRIVCQPQKVNLHTVVNQNIKLLKNNSDIKHIAVYNLIPEDCTALLDVKLIHVIIRNLLSNAIKYNKENGAVTFAVQQHAEHIELSIEDTGIGMEQADIPKLFRIDVDTKTIGSSAEKGTGLGLILVKEMLDKCKATINVESQKEVGSKFIIFLPYN